MSTATLPLTNKDNAIFPSLPQMLANVARHHVDELTSVCDKFLDWQHRQILAGEPTTEALAEHRKALKILLHATRLVHCQVSDPDYSDRTLARNLSIRIRQLEESWQMIHEPMPETEADKIIRQVFPNEP